MSRINRFSDGNRSKLEIMAKILREVNKPTGITCILTSCNMSFKQSGYYLELMKSSDLIHMNSTEGRARYCRTETGQEFLEAYDKMILMLEPSVFEHVLM
jgi:predicted transcriptional regulator